eukprot:14112043-Alexandrium_andersonii.AAC.1
MKNEPTILIEWGAHIHKRTERVNDAFMGGPMGRSADGYDLDHSRPHSTVTKHNSKGQTYLESRPRSNGVSH